MKKINYDVTGDIFKHYCELNPTIRKELNIPTYALDVTYKRDLDEYFTKVKKCEVQDKMLLIMSDMYDKIKKLEDIYV